MDEFDFALEDCLKQLGSGRSSLAQCLGRYPQYAAELRPLLETSLRMQKGKNVRPSGAARDRTRNKLFGYMDAHPRKPRNLGQVPRFAFLGLVVMLALAVVSTAFAQSALPGQVLYSWKLSTERAWRASSPDPVAVDITLAERREAEILAIAQNAAHSARDDSSVVAESEGITAYTDVLERLANEAAGPNGPEIITVLKGHQRTLSGAGIHVPKLDDIVSHGASQNGQGHGPNGPTKP